MQKKITSIVKKSTAHICSYPLRIDLENNGRSLEFAFFTCWWIEALIPALTPTVAPLLGEHQRRCARVEHRFSLGRIRADTHQSTYYQKPRNGERGWGSEAPTLQEARHRHPFHNNAPWRQRCGLPTIAQRRERPLGHRLCGGRGGREGSTAGVR